MHRAALADLSPGGVRKRRLSSVLARSHPEPWSLQCEERAAAPDPDKRDAKSRLTAREWLAAQKAAEAAYLAERRTEARQAAKLAAWERQAHAKERGIDIGSCVRFSPTGNRRPERKIEEAVVIEVVQPGAPVLSRFVIYPRRTAGSRSTVVRYVVQFQLGRMVCRAADLVVVCL